MNKFTVSDYHRTNAQDMCECNNLDTARQIALALRRAATQARHYAVFKGDEMLWNTRDGNIE